MNSAEQVEAFILGEKFNDPIDLNVIPPITDSMGKHWRQPDMGEVLIDDTTAILPRLVFDGLAEYSTSQPSGVYPGKCWKRNKLKLLPNGGYEHSDEWWLCWFGLHPDPKFVSNNYRKILIA